MQENKMLKKILIKVEPSSDFSTEVTFPQAGEQMVSLGRFWVMAGILKKKVTKTRRIRQRIPKGLERYMRMSMTIPKGIMNLKASG